LKIIYNFQTITQRHSDNGAVISRYQ